MRSKVVGVTQRKHEAVFICGRCGKKWPIEDGVYEDILKGNIDFQAPTKCKHFSYASKIQAKYKVNTKDWRMGYGST